MCVCVCVCVCVYVRVWIQLLSMKEKHLEFYETYEEKSKILQVGSEEKQTKEGKKEKEKWKRRKCWLSEKRQGCLNQKEKKKK